MRWFPSGVVKKRGRWAVQVESEGGEQRELAYPTQQQARFIAEVLSMGPRQLPPAAVKIRKRLAALPDTGAEGPVLAAPRTPRRRAG